MSIIDTQSVKISRHVNSVCGLDGNKKIKGRKQHVVVDTLGLSMSIDIHKANIHDNKEAP